MAIARSGTDGCIGDGAVGKEILTYDDLLQIVELIKSAEAFSEFHLKIGDIELDLRKSGAGTSNPSSATAMAPAPVEAITAGTVEDAVPAPPLLKPTVDIPAGSVVIKSPMVGTFYRSPEPGAKPFVEVGQRVSPETTVCIVEVMKLMNSVSAGCAGRVTHVLVDDAEPVEMGQALIVIDPKG
jgi:acetyl-CoA carboxylase biotin carboxyl carrier protein